MVDSEIVYAGDDLTDVPILRRVGLEFARADARPEVKRCAHHITTAGGGAGGVREMAEICSRRRVFGTGC